MPKLVVMHTARHTIAPLHALLKMLQLANETVNLADDSLLPELMANGGDVATVSARVSQYMLCATMLKVKTVLFACPAIGDLAAQFRSQFSGAIVRIDEAMAAEAVRRATRRIGVVALGASTLNPTLRLMQRRLKELGRKTELETMTLPEAYQRLLDDDQAGHDALVSEAVSQLAARVDVVALPEVMTARVAAQLPDAVREQCLPCTQLALERVKWLVDGSGQLNLRGGA